MGLLDGKVAIITGAGGGLGRSHALAMAKEGAKIVVNDLGGSRDGTGKGTKAADAVVDEIKNLGGQAVPNYDSVATMEGGKRIVQTAVDKFGTLDILVNNAGILRDRTCVKMTEEEWDLVVSIHLKGTFAVAQPAVTFMKEKGVKGRIINTTSYAGLIGNFGQTNYSSAKAGIYGFTRTLSMEMKKHGITVNALAPVALTRLTEDLPMFQGAGDAMPPESISPAVVFLASDLAAEVTGKVIGVMGHKVYAFRMIESEGVTKEGSFMTPQEIAKNIDQILGE